MHTFILRIYICGIQLQEQRYHISGIAVPVYWNSGAILAGIFIESLDEIKEKYAENTDGMERDIPDGSVNVESTVLEPIAVSKFLDTLSETNRKILTMRMDDVTLEKIAEELGFKTHSAIHKRIRKIGLAYEKFSGEDLGFSNKKII